jgi:pimeloyl-ACP methyl ester carboxylesterase
MTEAYLDVPGATLFYKTSGTGPVLLILQGGAGDADGSDDLMHALADRYTVVAYDRRGLSRSTLPESTLPESTLPESTLPGSTLRAGTQPPGVRTHSDDASRLLAHLTGEPAFVFGSSIGAVIGLDLVTTHPEQVRLLVAHEAAIAALLPEPARGQLLAGQRDVEDTFHRDGLLPAMRKLLGIAGGIADDGAEVERTAPASDRVAQHGRNMQFFLAHDAPGAHRYLPDLRALTAARTSIAPAGGTLGHDSFPYQCARALAGHLDRPLTEFPGGHIGYAQRPGAFAEALRHALSEQGLSEQGLSEQGLSEQGLSEHG